MAHQADLRAAQAKKRHVYTVLNSLSLMKVCECFLCLGLALAGVGCAVSDEPWPRWGSYATATVGTTFLDLDTLGAHRYYNGWRKKAPLGIVYTCHGGHIDIAHLRIGADYTKYNYEEIKRHLLACEDEYAFKLNVDRSQFYAHWTFPPGWYDLPATEQIRIADEVALDLAQYFTFMMLTWHEVLTFFGFKTLGIVPEYPSAFSWEDNYSNLLGVRIAATAIRDPHRDFDAAMTAHLEAELKSLGIQTADTARYASEVMSEHWYEGDILVTMRVRHTDIGLYDGVITPLLVPGICEQAEPRTYPVPTLEKAAQFGFDVTLYVEPKEFEKNDILQVVCPEMDCQTVCLPDDLPILMAHIESQARAQGCEIFNRIFSKAPATRPSAQNAGHLTRFPLN
jgi:hypothetical protein